MNSGYLSEYQNKYNKITDNFLEYGFDYEEIERSRELLSSRIYGRYYLKEVAYKPTGIALGYPLSDITSFEIVVFLEKIEKIIKEYLLVDNQVISYVPQDSYHITLLNHTHFEKDKVVLGIDENIKKQVQSIVEAIDVDIVKVHVKGLVITRSGRLLLAGYPLDDKLQQIRHIISTKIPELRVNTPTLAHIKIGHLIIPFRQNEKSDIFCEILGLGNSLDALLTFKDIYTPMGRIKFQTRPR